jgi:2'-5' RNA ligase
VAKNEHLVVIPVDPIEKGKQFIDWPLHITIVPWFAVADERSQELDYLLSEVAQRHNSLEAKVGQIALLGSNNVPPVALILPNSKLNDLHNDVLNSLETNGFMIHQKAYTGSKYRPHITTQNGHNIPAGTVLNIDSFSLIHQTRQKITGTMVKELQKSYRLKIDRIE